MSVSMTTTTKNRWLIVAIVMGVLSVLFLTMGTALADTPNIGKVADNIRGSMSNLAQLITAGSYVAGFGFAVGAILKFKAHKDQPQQIPVGTPIALVFIAAALIFLPAIFGVSGETMFGSTTNQGTVSGVDTFS